MRRRTPALTGGFSGSKELKFGDTSRGLAQSPARGVFSMIDPMREIGSTGIRVSPVALGCWPITGMTSIDVVESESRKTISAALAAGINFLDTAYCYGANGESERMIGDAIEGNRQGVVIASKGGIHWDEKLQRQQDARPETILREFNESLNRLRVDMIDLHYLHAPDPKVPLNETASAYRSLLDSGRIRSVGLSNVTLDQLREFELYCPVHALQPPYNMLQRGIEADLLPYCLKNGISVFVYWPLMKGLLAGKLQRDHQFDPRDGRAKYPMFQGVEWQKNQDFLERLRGIANRVGRTISQVVINWTIHQAGVTGALCGAKRPAQIEETAASFGWRLPQEIIDEIELAIRDRGEVVTKSAV